VLVQVQYNQDITFHLRARPRQGRIESGIESIELDFRAMFKHVGSNGLEGYIKIVGVPKEQGR
jgi:hypothetical protein